jgi:hypothetical protein
MDCSRFVVIAPDPLYGVHHGRDRIALQRLEGLFYPLFVLFDLVATVILSAGLTNVHGSNQFMVDMIRELNDAIFTDHHHHLPQSLD